MSNERLWYLLHNINSELERHYKVGLDLDQIRCVFENDEEEVNGMLDDMAARLGVRQQHIDSLKELLEIRRKYIIS